jgi:hypothetical protein
MLPVGAREQSRACKQCVCRLTQATICNQLGLPLHLITQQTLWSSLEVPGLLGCWKKEAEKVLLFWSVHKTIKTILIIAIIIAANSH